MIKCSKGREQILTALSSEVGISNQKEEEEDLELRKSFNWGLLARELTYFFASSLSAPFLFSSDSPMVPGRGHTQERTKTHRNATGGGEGSVGATGREV